jgi:hypothetical protein
MMMMMMICVQYYNIVSVFDSVCWGFSKMLRNAFDRQGNYRSRAADFDSRPKMAPPQLLRERERWMTRKTNQSKNN